MQAIVMYNRRITTLRLLFEFVFVSIRLFSVEFIDKVGSVFVSTPAKFCLANVVLTVKRLVRLKTFSILDTTVSPCAFFKDINLLKAAPQKGVKLEPVGDGSECCITKKADLQSNLSKV